MSRKRFSSSFVVAFSTLSALTHAGETECLSTPTPEEVEIIRSLDRAGVYSLREDNQGVRYVPLTLHIVRTSEGTGGIDIEQVFQSVVDSNAAFAQAGIVFCVPGEIRYVDNDTFYFALNTRPLFDELRRRNPAPGTINIYFAPDPRSNGSSICGTASFTTSPVQGIIVKNSCAGLPSNPSTVPHEIGHYLDLYHTHETAFGRECTDASNCDVAGDLICDTPADPNLTNRVSTACQYTGVVAPTCGGLPYAPDTLNLMSYSRKTCRTDFTPQQVARMRATLHNLRPQYIRELPGDATQDGVVDFADLSIVLTSFGAIDGGTGDVNADGGIDFADLNIVLTAFGQPCR
ncbi:MAG: hypothetical protein KF684_02865 [Phycisphaeraceae bacterium]|nr:hypothetical protein [Phycisphaeraceae bacterium]